MQLPQLGALFLGECAQYVFRIVFFVRGAKLVAV